MKKGDFVMSYHKSCWTGIILYSFPAGTHLVLVIKDRNGHRPRKRIAHIRSGLKLKLVEPVDITDINLRWFNTEGILKLRHFNV